MHYEMKPCTHCTDGKVVKGCECKAPCGDCEDTRHVDCLICQGDGWALTTEEDMAEEAHDRMLNAADANYERSLDK